MFNPPVFNCKLRIGILLVLLLETNLFNKLFNDYLDKKFNICKTFGLKSLGTIVHEGKYCYGPVFFELKNKGICGYHGSALNEDTYELSVMLIINSIRNDTISNINFKTKKNINSYKLNSNLFKYNDNLSYFYDSLSNGITNADSEILNNEINANVVQENTSDQMIGNDPFDEFMTEEDINIENNPNEW